MKSSLKKFSIIILTNIIVFLGIFTILNKYVSSLDNVCDISNLLSKMNYFKRDLNVNSINIDKYDVENWNGKLLELNNDSYNEFCGEKRVEFGEGNNYTKRPIVILGGSYAYGHGLKKENTFPYLLSKYTQRPVYNFSVCGIEGLTSVKYLLDYISMGEEYKNKVSNPEYYIYVYMHDHINRFLNIQFLYIYYETFFEVHNKIYKRLLKFPVIKLVCTYWQFNKLINKKSKSQVLDIEESSKFLKKIIIYINEELKKISPDSKFIILLYNSKNSELYNPFKIMFDTETGFVFDKDYCLQKDIAPTHPNEKAWAILTPLFAKKLN